MFIEPTITWVLSGFSWYIWLDTKIVLKKVVSGYFYISAISTACKPDARQMNFEINI